jgi:GNAT superfamily N-acetyltransferase
MKIGLNIKIITLLLLLGYALPTHTMSGLLSRLKCFSTQQQTPAQEHHTPQGITSNYRAKEIGCHGDVTIIQEEPNVFGDVNIRAIQGLYKEDNIAYGNEVGLVGLSPCSLDCLTVRPEWRKHGYGTLLFKEAEKYSKQMYPFMRWYVAAYSGYGSKINGLDDEALRKFYEKLGGKTTDGCHFEIDFRSKDKQKV